MSEKRRGLGRGLGALIPTGTAPVTRPAGDRPVDVFFPGREGAEDGPPTATTTDAEPVAPLARSGGPGLSSTAVSVLPGHRTAMAPAPEALTRPEQVGTGEPAGRGDTAGRGDAGIRAALPAARLAPVPSGPAVAEPRLQPVPATAHVGPAQLAPVPEAASWPAPSGSTPATSSAPELLPVPGASFAEIPVGDIRPNPRQPRTVFDEESLAELVHSIREIGVLQPVVVRSVPGERGPSGGAQYELIMGERRLRATKEAGLDRIPAIVRDTQDDAMLRDALLENLHRAELNPLEEAAAYQQLLDDFGCTHEELATRIGRSRPQISNTIRLLKLPPLVQRRVAAAVLSAGHARALLGLEDQATMERLAQRIVAEGLSVRAVEEIVALGDGPVAKPAKKRPRAGSNTSELDDLASRLGDRLDTRVAIALGRSKGRMSIEFASVDDLNRIIGLLSPEVRGAFRKADA